MSKKGSKKNNSSRHKSKSIPKSLLKTLLGGDGDGGEGSEGSTGNNVNAVAATEKPSALSFFNRFSSKLPSEKNSGNGADEDNEPVPATKTSTGSTKLASLFSLSSVKANSGSDTNAAAAAATAATTTDASPSSSTWWFVFRVVLVLIIALVFLLNLTGYLDGLVAWFTNTMGPYINPILVKIGLMESPPNTGTDGTGAGTGAGTGTGSGAGAIDQLEQNVGNSPEQQQQQQEINELKPIPIQPDERQTPLVNKGESTRPLDTQPAPYHEETSREQEKEESIKQALEYAAKHQQPVPDDSSSNTQIPRSKSGFCFIGNFSNTRSCIEVSPNDKCMSGDIFPSMDVCVNPRLRV
jgi:hypothetical protein